jgi:hypothetical protein
MPESRPGGEAVSSRISQGDQFLWVSNQRFSTLLDFAREVGGEVARSDQERHYVERLRRFAEEEAWPGIDFDLEKRFPGVAEKKFWAGVFHDLGRRIFLRQIGHHDATSWQSSAIGDAYIVARMLTRAVQEEGEVWDPDTANQREAEEDHGSRINVRL